jgi:hypothetical protein
MGRVNRTTLDELDIERRVYCVEIGRAKDQAEKRYQRVVRGSCEAYGPWHAPSSEVTCPRCPVNPIGRCNTIQQNFFY